MRFAFDPVYWNSRPRVTVVIIPRVFGKSGDFVNANGNTRFDSSVRVQTDIRNRTVPALEKIGFVTVEGSGEEFLSAILRVVNINIGRS